MKYLHILISILFLTSVNSSSAQYWEVQLSGEHEKKIDQLFVDWDKPNQPGGVAGVMLKGKLLYLKAYGLASLEYKVPNTVGTQFNIASVSKQFTSMGILKLEKEGKLNIDDDIRNYLPDLPDFGHKITFKHCMQHTSGMRSLHAMLGMAGWREDDTRTDEDLFRFMKRQKDLNFIPGSDELYCNTGYMLLALIIERITKMPFSIWMKREIFEPLGMEHTYVEDDYDRVVPNNATSYYIGHDAYLRAVEFWGYVGSGNIHSTVEDLLKWQENFVQPAKGWEGLFEKIQEEGSLNNGEKIGYGLGISTNTFRGEPWIGHGGAIGGFRSNIAVFPKEQLNLVVLTNFSRGNPGAKVFDMAAILMNKTTSQQAEDPEPVKIRGIAVSNKVLSSYEGEYWQEEDKFSRTLYVENDTLWYSRSIISRNALIPIAKDEFQMAGIAFEAFVSFEKTKKGKWDMLFTQGKVMKEFESYQKPTISEKFLNAFVGKYYSPELESYYSMYIEGDQLMGYHVRHGEFRIDVLRDNYLEASLGAFGSLKIKRSEDGKVLGLYASNGRVRNLWFEKL